MTYRITNALPHVLSKFSGKMTDLWTVRLETYGVTLPMYRVLASLAERPDQRLVDLSEMARVEISTLSRLIGVMKRLGYVTRMRADTDERTVRINLTTAGGKIAEELIGHAVHYGKLLVGGIAPEEIDRFRGVIGQLERNLALIEAEYGRLGSGDMIEAAPPQSRRARA